MMIRAFVPRSASRSCAEFWSIFTIDPGTWSKEATVSRSCLSSTRRSVTTTTLWNTGSFALSPAARTAALNWAGSAGVCRVDNRCASQAMVFDFPDPAECWISLLLPGPCARAAVSSRRTASHW